MSTTSTCISLEQAHAKLWNSFPFEIEKFPNHGPDGSPFLCEKGKQKTYTLTRSDTGAAVGSTCGPHYTPQNHEHLSKFVTAYHHAVGGIGTMETSWKDGHVLVLRPQEGATVEINGYTLSPILMLKAGLRGEAIVSRLGLFNFVCANGLFSLDMDKSMVHRIPHNRFMDGRIDDLVEDITALGRSLPDVQAKLEAASKRDINFYEFMLAIEPLSADDATDAQRRARLRRIEQMAMRFANERVYRGMDVPDISRHLTVNGLEAYNMAQGFAQHDRNRKNSPNGTDRMLLAINDKAVKTASELALA